MSLPPGTTPLKAPDLHPEILLTIQQYCDFPTLLRFLRTCKTYRDRRDRLIDRWNKGRTTEMALEQPPSAARQLIQRFDKKFWNDRTKPPQEGNWKLFVQTFCHLYADSRCCRSTPEGRQRMQNVLDDVAFVNGRDTSRKAFLAMVRALEPECRGACRSTGLFNTAPQWGGVPLQTYLEGETLRILNFGTNCRPLLIPCMSYRSLPAKVRAFLKLAVAAAKRGELLFPMDPSICLAHTSHWDTDGLLPWLSLTERSKEAKDLGSALKLLNELENNVHPEKCTLTHVKDRWNKHTFPATMEYAVCCLGPTARLIISLDAPRGPLVFISSHYGSSVPKEDRNGRAHFLIEDIHQDPISADDRCHEAEFKYVEKAVISLNVTEVKDLKLRSCFPEYWTVPERLKPDWAECVNKDFWRMVGKCVELKQGKTLHFDMIFDAEGEGHDMKIIEIVKAEENAALLPVGAFDVRLSVRAEDCSVHIGMRPWADRESGYSSSNVGLPTSYLWFSIFFNRNTGEFAIGPRGSDPFGKSKLNFLVCWKWLQRENNPQLTAIYNSAVKRLNEYMARLNEAASPVRQKLKDIAKKHPPDGGQ